MTIPDNKTYYAKWTDVEASVDDGFFRCGAGWSSPSGSDITNLGDLLVFRPTSGGTISAHLSMIFERAQDKQYKPREQTTNNTREEIENGIQE